MTFVRTHHHTDGRTREKARYNSVDPSLDQPTESDRAHPTAPILRQRPPRGRPASHDAGRGRRSRRGAARTPWGRPSSSAARDDLRADRSLASHEETRGGQRAARSAAPTCAPPRAASRAASCARRPRARGQYGHARRRGAAAAAIRRRGEKPRARARGARRRRRTARCWKEVGG